MSIGKMIDRKTAEGWKEWLRQMHWDFFATGTWKQPVSGFTSQRTVDTWLSEFPDAFAAVGIQEGPNSKRLHVHLLIGGLSGVAATRLRGSWVKHGHVLMKRYDPRPDVISYVVNQAEEMRLIGTPQMFRPKRRRR